MTIESTLREALTGQAEFIELGPLASIDEVAGLAGRRTRRNRVLTGAGALIFAFLLVLGVNGRAGTEETGLVIADEITPDIASQLQGERLQPSIVQTGPNGDFYGLATAEVELPDGLQSGSVAVRSADGLRWSFVEGSPIFQLSQIRLVADPEGLSLVGLDGDALISARSPDGILWTQNSTELGSDAFALSEVAEDDGEITALLFELPDNQDTFVEPPASQDPDGNAVCEMIEQRADEAASYRLCGMSSFEQVPTTDSIPLESATVVAYEGPVGGELKLKGEVDPFSAFFAGAVTSGVDELAVTVVSVNGETYTVDLGALYTDVAVPEPRVASLHGGIFAGVGESAHGFSVVVHRWGKLRPVRVEDVRIQNGDFVLDAIYPKGRATLTTTAGETLRTWDQFEFGNLSWSGVDVEVDGVIIRSSSGDALASFSHDEWVNALVPQRFPMSDVIYSPDGQTWSIIATLDSQARVIAVGDAEVLVRSTGPAGAFSDSREVLFDQSIPLPSELGNTAVALVDGEAPSSLSDLAEVDPEAEAGVVSSPESITTTTTEGLDGSGSFSPILDENGVRVRPFTASGLPPASQVERFDIEVGGGLSEADSAARIDEQGQSDAFTLNNPRLAASFAAPDGAFDFYIGQPDAEGGICTASTRFTQDERWQSSGGGCSSGGWNSLASVASHLDDFAHWVRLNSAPPQAAWMVVELADGSLRKIEVIEGRSAAIWPREEPAAVAISVQAADFTEVYAEVLDN